jgi:hypothetical protein
VNDETIDINTEDVEYDQTDAQPPASNTSSLAKRPLELTDIEGSFKQGVTSALQQRPLFILDKDTITAADATAFQIQANRWNDIFALSEVDLLDICILTDTSFTMLSDTDVSRWLELLTVAQATELVIRYFADSGRTLAENFGNLRFAFSFADPSVERATMMAMVNLVQSQEQLSGPISPSQHAHLNTLIEKRLPADSQIRTDYFLRRGPRAHPDETWKDRCISDVWASMKNESHGDPARVYDLHPDALRHLLPRRVASKATSSAPTPLVRRSELATPAPPRDPVCCPSSWHYGHDRPTCPHRWQSDVNNDLTLSWADSYLGRKWLSYCHHLYEVDLVLPAYEERHSINHHGLAHGSPSAQGSTKQARFNDRPLESCDKDDRGRDDRRKPGKSHYQPVRCKSPPISAPASAPLLPRLPPGHDFSRPDGKPQGHGSASASPSDR